MNISKEKNVCSILVQTYNIDCRLYGIWLFMAAKNHATHIHPKHYPQITIISNEIWKVIEANHIELRQ